MSAPAESSGGSGLSHRAAIGLAIATALLFSTGGAGVKLVSLGAWPVAAGRALFAALAVAILLPQSRHGWTRRTVLVGLCYALTIISFVHANKLTTSAAAIFLQATAPLHVILLSRFVLHETPRRRDLLLAVVFALGMVLLFLGVDRPSDTAPRPLLGNAVALGSGLAYALTLMGLRALGRERGSALPGSAPPSSAQRRGDPGLGAVVCGNLIALAISLPWALPMPRPSLPDVLLIAFLGTFQIGIAYALMSIAFRRLRAVEGALLLLLEPVLNPVWSAWLLGEVPGLWSVLGGTVVVGGTVAQVVGDR